MKQHPYVIVYLMTDSFRGDRTTLGVLTEAGFVENHAVQDLDSNWYELAQQVLVDLRETPPSLELPSTYNSCVAGSKVRYSPEMHESELVSWVKLAVLIDIHPIARSFGWAVNRLKRGRHVARQNWYGKGMFLVLEQPSDLTIQPYISLWNALGRFQPGWTASQEDMLATDWTEVKDHQDKDSE